MNRLEPNAILREVPVYLVDVANVEVTGASPVGSQLMISLDGEVWQNASGVWIELNNGGYLYRATQAETDCYSFFMLRVAATGAKVFVFVIPIGDRVGGENRTLALRVPIYLEDVSGNAVPSLAISGAEAKLSRNGAAFANGAGVVHEIGGVGNGLGGYYYQAPATEQDYAGGPHLIRINKTGALIYIYPWPVTTVAVPANPIPAPFAAADPEYMDHAAGALDRLPEQFKAKAS